jgi:hypothetical protein
MPLLQVRENSIGRRENTMSADVRVGCPPGLAPTAMGLHDGAQG